MTPLLTLLIIAAVGVFASGMGISRIFTPIPVSVMAMHSVRIN